MKKFLAMILALAMVLSMVACSKQPAKDPNQGNTDNPGQTETITEDVYKRQPIRVCPCP